MAKRNIDKNYTEWFGMWLLNQILWKKLQNID